MTSHGRRDNDHPMFTSKIPQFFKVILQETIRDGILGIPRRFVRKYGNQLSNQVKLEVPSGVIWQVELTKTDDGRVRFENGWREFAEHYSLEFGAFVVFRYKGNDHFHVLIFDKTASEIGYPYFTTEEDDNDPCDEVPASRKNKEKSDLPCPLPRKKMRTDTPYKTETKLKLENLSSQINLDDLNYRKIQLGNIKKNENSRTPGKFDGVGRISARRSVKTAVLGCSQNLTATEKARAMQIVTAFKSTGNPFFMVVMRPSFVGDKCRMCIPTEFARKFLPKHNCDLTLLDSAGNTWPVKYYNNAENKKPLVQLHGGWQVFVEDNHLYVHDICIFEVIKQHPEILMKVVINPVFENAGKVCMPQAHKSIAGRVRTRSLLSDTEFDCQRTRCPSSSREFKVSEKSVDFQSLKEELGGEFKCLAKHYNGVSAGRSLKMGVLSCSQKLTDTENAQAIQRASAFKSTENPVFMVVMQPSFICSIYRMCIPSDFARKFLPKHSCDLTLLNSAGKTWLVNYYYNAENRRAKLYGGWQAFVEDNHLDVGDICVFELIKHPEIFMKVVIYPVSENVTKVCRPPTHGTIASQVKTRSSVNDTEPYCQQSSCPFSSRKIKYPTDSYIEILDDSLLNQKTKKEWTSPSFQPCKVMRTNPSGSIEAMGIKLEKEKNTNSQYLTIELGGERKHSAKDDNTRMLDVQRCLKPDLMGKIKIEPLTPTEKQNGCIGASGFRTSNPSFSVLIQPSYVSSCSPLHIPEKFAMTYLQKDGEIILRVPDGRTWIVEYETIETNGRKKAMFSSQSWGPFAKENELKVGDVCIFELIKENGNLLEVVIQREHLLIEMD